MDSTSHGNLKNNTDCIIVGAGLSGLATAYYFKKHGIEATILEARDRVGGRIQTSDSIDLGATWFGSEHDHLIELLDRLNIKSFPQYRTGKGIFIHSTAEPPHYFETDENSSSTFRISGGSTRLIDALTKHAAPMIEHQQEVKEIHDNNGFVELITGGNLYKTKKAVITVPLQLAAHSISFTPALPNEVVEEMKSTHTWMSNAIKIGLIFDSPFWREKNLSGTLIAPNGPVIELYDHSEPDGSRYALMGFANEALRNYTPDERKKRFVDFLAEHLGDQIHDYLNYLEKDWMEDKYTATPLSKSIYMHPNYGNKLWQQPYMNGKLSFTTSETSSTFGGYMEGAVAAGKKVAEFYMTGG